MVEDEVYVMLMMMRADENYTSAEGCTAEELLACTVADDIDACMAACNGNGNEPEEPTGNGYIKVTKVSVPATQSVALNAVDKNIGTIKLTAGDYDTTVSSIVIEKAGLGQTSDIAMIQLSKNGDYVATATTNKNNKFTLRFSPAITIKAGKSETFDVLVNLQATGAGSSLDFSVVDAKVANGKVDNLPLALGSLTVANYTVPEATVTTLTAGKLESGKRGDFATVTIKPGVESTVDGFTISAVEGTEFTKMLDNVKAYINNEEVGSVTLDDEKVIVKGLKSELSKTASLTVKVKADDIFVGNEWTGTLFIDTGHVNVTEKSTNERMNSKYKATTSALSIKGVNLSLKNLTTKAQTAALGAKDVVLLDAQLSANVEYDVDAFTVSFDNDPTTALENIALYIDGVDQDITAQTAGRTGTKYRFSVDSSTPVSIQVKADVKDEFTGTANFTVTFAVTQLYNPTEKSYIPVSDKSVKGHKTTISAGDVSLSKTVVSGISNTIKEGETADLLYFTLEAKTEDQRLTGVVFTYSGGALSGLVNTIKLYNEDTLIDTLESDDIDGLTTTIPFTDLATPLPTDEKVYFTLKAEMKDGEVTNLGSKLEVSLAAANVSTSRTDDTPTTVNGNAKSIIYTISTDTPTIKLTIDDTTEKLVAIEITNPSDYYLILDKIYFDILKNIDEANGTIVNWSGTGYLYNDYDEVIEGKAIPASNIVYNLAQAYSIAPNGGTIEYTLNPEGDGVKLTSKYISIEEKQLDFLYDEDGDATTTGDVSAMIQKTY